MGSSHILTFVCANCKELKLGKMKKSTSPRMAELVKPLLNQNSGQLVCSQYLHDWMSLALITELVEDNGRYQSDEKEEYHKHE